MRALSFSIAIISMVAFWTGDQPSAMAQANTPAASTKAAPSPNGSFSSNVNTAGPIAPDKAHPLDVNAASAAELNALPGISADRSDAIVAGRPYRSKYDLVKRNILPKEQYDRIKDLINVKGQ
jgi:DNA uptake protein ComE-like DNA-binding protein